jgi:predicted ArsR family transcriptional regulator
MKTINDVPLILRREIEARMAAPFLRAFAEEFGEEKTHEIAARVIGELASQAGADMAEMVEENSLEQFMEHILPIFQCGMQEIEVKEASNDRVRMDVVKCPYVDMYRRIGLADMGVLLSCYRDPYLFTGYNPDFRFTRTKTIMEGGDCCDFCIERKKG